MRLPGFGPKRARKLFDELGIDSIDALRAALEAGTIRELRGFGLKAEAQLKETLAGYEAAAAGRAARRALARARRSPRRSWPRCATHPASDRVEVAGSLRRRADSVKDLDIIATASDPKALARTLGELELVESVQSSGDAGARVTTHTGMKIDLKVVEPDQFGNVLQHFTGSKAHNVALREAPSAAACTSPSTGSSTTRPARRCAARARRRSTSGSATRGSRPSCARAAASSRPRATARCPS